MHSLLGQLLDGRFVLTDRTGSVTRWSRPAEVLFGRATKEALGKPLLTLVGSDLEVPALGGVARTMARRPDGDQLELELAIVPVPMSQSLEFTGMLEGLEAGLSPERLSERHPTVAAWMSDCLAGTAHLGEDEVSAGTIIVFKPLDDKLLRELDRAEPPPPPSAQLPSGAPRWSPATGRPS